MAHGLPMPRCSVSALTTRIVLVWPMPPFHPCTTTMVSPSATTLRAMAFDRPHLMRRSTSSCQFYMPSCQRVNRLHTRRMSALTHHLVKVGLGLAEEEGIHAAILFSDQPWRASLGDMADAYQVCLPGRSRIPSDHEDGSNRSVLADQTGRLAGRGQDDNTASVEVEGRADSSH